MKKKKNSKLFWLCLGSLFIVFCGLSIANKTGYYESRLNDRVTLTNEAIKKFERDISQGKDVSLNNYFEKEKIDYSNKISNAGLTFSKGVEDVMNDGLKNTFKVLSKLFS